MSIFLLAIFVKLFPLMKDRFGKPREVFCSICITEKGIAKWQLNIFGNFSKFRNSCEIARTRPTLYTLTQLPVSMLVIFGNFPWWMSIYPLILIALRVGRGVRKHRPVAARPHHKRPFSCSSGRSLSGPRWNFYFWSLVGKFKLQSSEHLRRPVRFMNIYLRIRRIARRCRYVRM